MNGCTYTRERPKPAIFEQLRQLQIDEKMPRKQGLIRTLWVFEQMSYLLFKTAALDHSATHPILVFQLSVRWPVLQYGLLTPILTPASRQGLAQ